MLDKSLRDKLLESKNPVVIFLFGILTGLTFYFKDITCFYFILFFLGLSFLLYLIKKKILILLISLLVGYFYPLVFYKYLRPDLGNLLDKKSIFIGEVVSEYEISSFYNKKFYLRLTSVLSESFNKKKLNSKVLVIGSNYEEYSTGDLIQVTGILKKPKAGLLPGLFDEKKYLFSKDVYYLIKAEKGSLIFLDEPESTYIIRKITKLRKKIIALNKYHLSGDNLALVNGIVFGSKAARINSNLKDKIQDLGLSHITSASGFNVSILVGGVFWLLRLIKANSLVSTLVSIFVTLAYTFIADFSASILRAGCFIVLILIGNMFGKKLRILPGVGFILLLFFIVSPGNLLDVGLQLSVLAFLGISFFYSESQRVLLTNMSKLLTFIFGIFLQSLFAQIVTIPLIVFYFHNVQLLGIISNLLAVPLAWIILLLGIIGITVSFLPILNYLNVIVYYFLDLFSDLFLLWINILDKLSFKKLFLPNIDFYFLILIYFVIVFLLISFFISNFGKWFKQVLVTFLLLTLILCLINYANNSFKIFFVPRYNHDLILVIPPHNEPIIFTTVPDKKIHSFLDNFLRLNKISSNYTFYNLNSNINYKDDLLSITDSQILLTYKKFSFKILKKYQGKITDYLTLLKLPKLKGNDPDFSSLFVNYPECLVINDYKKLSKKSIRDSLWLSKVPSMTYFLSKTGTVTLTSNGLKYKVIKSE